MNFTKESAIATAAEVTAHDVEDDAWEYRPVHIGQNTYRVAVIDDAGIFMGWLGSATTSKADRELFRMATIA